MGYPETEREIVLNQLHKLQLGVHTVIVELLLSAYEKSKPTVEYLQDVALRLANLERDLKLPTEAEIKELDATE